MLILLTFLPNFFFRNSPSDLLFLPKFARPKLQKPPGVLYYTLIVCHFCLSVWDKSDYVSHSRPGDDLKKKTKWREVRSFYENSCKSWWNQRHDDDNDDSLIMWNTGCYQVIFLLIDFYSNLATNRGQIAI